MALAMEALSTVGSVAAPTGVCILRHSMLPRCFSALWTGHAASKNWKGGAGTWDSIANESAASHAEELELNTLIFATESMAGFTVRRGMLPRCL